MKKILGAILTVTLALSLLSAPVFAAERIYRMDEVGILVQVPSHLLTLARDVKANDPALAALEMSRDEALSQMEDLDIYLIAMDEWFDYMIYVVAGESGMEEDYTLVSDADVADMISMLEAEYAEVGIDMDSAEIYQVDQVKFAKVYLSDNEAEEPFFALQYHTILDGQWISIELDSYTETITAQQERDIRTMVDSFMYDGGMHDQQTPLSAPAFLYTDEESGMTFTVPANWVEESMSATEEFIDVQFASTLERNLYILFTSLDLFTDSFMEEAGLTEAEKRQLTRAELDQSILTAAFASDAWGIPEAEIRRVVLGEKEYFFAQNVRTETVQGSLVSVPLSYLLRVENGYMYQFLFTATSESPYFQDFEALVSSAQYPQVEVQNGQSSSVLQLLRQGPAVYVPVLLISFALTLVGYSAFPLIFAGVRRKTITKKKYNLICYGVNFLVMIAFIVINDSASSGSPYILWTWIFSAIGTRILKKRGVLDGYQPDKPTEPEYDPPVEETAQPEAMHSIRFCHQCGNELAEGSRFCSKCGNELAAGWPDAGHPRGTSNQKQE